MKINDKKSNEMIEMEIIIAELNDRNERNERNNNKVK